MGKNVITGAGEIRECELEGCLRKFRVKKGREHQRYCCNQHRYRAWFLRTYVRREEVQVGTNRK